MEKEKIKAVITRSTLAVLLLVCVSSGGLAKDYFSITLTVRDIHHDPNPPTISVQIEGRSVWNNDYIKVRPNFDLAIKDDVAVAPESIMVTLDGKGLGYVTVNATQKELNLRAGVPYNLEEESIRTHDLKVEASDTYGNKTVKELTGLKVASGLVKLNGPLIITPVPFSLARDKEITIAYNMSSDALVTLFFSTPTGRQEMKASFPPGTEGGSIGYNEIKLQPGSQVFQRPLANGIYILQLIAEGKQIGKAYLVVYQ
ncbi:hypothetical protein A3K48_01510 [candidate division WOR-1 bacterium RIFOXYA12_FULL_52_29]|uniref:Uncharacterized protein n=1 Tax=candidate division WOR-1 bacterium RIFOXYC12_FULL_54_18 TaxID=1802584 RepID=A0A1F4T4P5_UNCSA|nr:MAG: hypothetical protein A3K44_01510 [candidate division WOR-1 bacterium RIFOXYA2_FULL_51_19]OGC17261.1 MAG: hypothetical protein A3K48_01510 [candidate division WOR-1 bacterium RIFOXYA12_FULL_52_29]OGC26121.1 MAG: hypothetical protein A3K32_01505 [candidate division WOR-1 bacterium RIFOXYB2_FULL_45_9]OGC27678.1 MAG: hypothetical protein A3K49_01510 [candidate division WOR-1 bacterium RIFOXYC12_FULL_54_18]OGC30031.1 MAG: hypothetical protein A2346_04825 [candidate division WOR-1 bacterium R